MPVISTSPQLRCRQCGSQLEKVDEVTEKIENYSSDVTTTRYRCIDESCQAAMDKNTKERVKNQKVQEEARLRRIEANSNRGKNKTVAV